MKLLRPSIIKKKTLWEWHECTWEHDFAYIDTQNAYFGGNHAATDVHGVMTTTKGKSYLYVIILIPGVRISGLLCTQISNTFFLQIRAYVSHRQLIYVFAVICHDKNARLNIFRRRHLYIVYNIYKRANIQTRWGYQ